MSFFEAVYSETMKNEGGYANNPADKGGETYCGISRKFHPGWIGWQHIDEIKEKRQIAWNEHFPELDMPVRNFYRSIFWDVINGDAYTEYELAQQMFDTAVNCGTSAAGTLLQRVLNVLNCKQKLWGDIKIDGVIGAKTIEALSLAYLAGKATTVLNAFIILRGSYYIGIMEMDETQEVWAENWLSRLNIR